MTTAVNQTDDLLNGLLINIGHIRGVTVSGNYVYLAANSSGMRVIDVSNPANPVEVGLIDIDDQALGVAMNDSYAYIAAGSAGLRVIDVSSSG